MGLDMYLTGENFFTTCEGVQRKKEEGFELKANLLALAYWRKHPNLHGYIVENFANGKDECQRIELCTDNILQIISTIKSQSLPYTEGFFFGESDLGKAQMEDDMALFYRAHDWLKSDLKGVWKSIYYQASW